MKLLCALLLAVVGHVAAAEPLFYILDVRHTGDAVLHSSSQGVSPKVALPYVLVDTPGMKCCFHVGLKPGQREPLIKIDRDAPPMSSDEGDETVQFLGYVNTPPTGTRGTLDSLAFGLAGMRSVSAKGKHAYEIALQESSKRVILRHCLGTEGINFRLYHHAADRKPYAMYYYAVGYDTKPDCR
jgi:hypothetical protein